MKELDLTGEWRASTGGSTEADFHTSEFDDSDWLTIDVPSHWSQHPDLITHSGPLFYRKQFNSSDLGERSWLQFDGVFNHASIWIDGAYVGDMDGYFAKSSYDVSSALAARNEHVVAVEVNASSFEIPWSAPGGIWQPVSIKQSGGVHIARSRVLVSEAREERGVLHCYLELDALESCEVSIRTVATSQTSSRETEHVLTRKLAVGSNRLWWHVPVSTPELWWPWSLGNQAFYDVSVSVTDTRTPEQPSDQINVRTGFRHVTYDRGFTNVNGERVFLQSVEAGNDGTLPLETDHKYFEEMIRARRDVGANLLARSQWIEPQAFYDVADELGMFVWQGVPSNLSRSPLPKHSRQMVEELGHHPSIAVWLRPQKKLLDRRPGVDTITRTLDKSDPTRNNIELPLAWDLNRMSPADVLAIVPKWAKRSRFLAFTADSKDAERHIEAVHLLKYRPLGGYIAPLALPERLNGAALPVTVVAVAKDQLRDDVEASVDIYVVNDTQVPIIDAVVSAVVSDRSWSWKGDVAADSYAYIATMTATPNSQGLKIELSLTGSGAPVERKVHLPVKRSRL